MELTARIRQILAGRGLLLSQVSSRSASVFGPQSRYYISDKMYYEISRLGHRPSIHQLASLSRITGYRLSDWLEVFEIHLDDIPRLQLLLPRTNTVMIDSSVYDQDSPIPWFFERERTNPRENITPLGQTLAYGSNIPVAMVLALGRRKFRYARVGGDDAYAFPEIAPGSLVRVDREAVPRALSSVGSACSKEVFLVAHGGKLHCGYLRRDRTGRLALCSKYFPFSHIELGSSDQVSVVGLVDAEFRIVHHPATPSPVNHLYEAEKLTKMPNRATRLNALLRAARLRAGLSLQEASTISRSIAARLGNSRYFAASGTLSDYENHPAVPHSVHKIVSLCVLYSVGFWDFLQAADVPIELLGSDRISNSASRTQRFPSGTEADKCGVSPGVFLTRLIDDWQEVPLFLRGALGAIAGLKHISLSDIYWVRDDPHPIHPLLVNAALIAVNRRIKKPAGPTRKTLWEQPLYLILKRDGGYLCGCCTLQHGTITIHSRLFSHQSTLSLKNGIDAEVIGQVTAILRRVA